MGSLEGRVAVVTGAGRGLGREHALLLAAEGARVVVNDVGGAPDGSGADAGVAAEVVAEIQAAGGEAVANTDDVSDWEGAKRLVDAAVVAFGDLHVLVNNAGILRDRMLVNMSEEEWDDVVRVHLKGHFCPTRFAVEYWRSQTRMDRKIRASVINTSSVSGLYGHLVGQTNYAAAKAGIAAMGMVESRELARYGVRVNTIAPGGRTRLTEQTPGLGERLRVPEQPGAFDRWDPANVSPLVAYLATEDCPITGRTFVASGGRVELVTGWSPVDAVERDGRWSVQELREALEGLAATDSAGD